MRIRNTRIKKTSHSLFQTIKNSNPMHVDFFIICIIGLTQFSTPALSLSQLASERENRLKLYINLKKTDRMV